jgi:hypothetical protein
MPKLVGPVTAFLWVASNAKFLLASQMDILGHIRPFAASFTPYPVFEATFTGQLSRALYIKGADAGIEG